MSTAKLHHYWQTDTQKDRRDQFYYPDRWRATDGQTDRKTDGTDSITWIDDSITWIADAGSKKMDYCMRLTTKAPWLQTDGNFRLVIVMLHVHINFVSDEQERADLIQVLGGPL